MLKNVKPSKSILCDDFDGCFFDFLIIFVYFLILIYFFYNFIFSFFDFCRGDFHFRKFTFWHRRRLLRFADVLSPILGDFTSLPTAKEAVKILEKLLQFGAKSAIIIWSPCDLVISYFYGEVLKWGASRPPPVADEGRRASVQHVLGYAEHCKFALGKHCASRSRQQGRRGDADSRTFLQVAFLQFNIYMEKYSSGDVCERRQRRSKRAIRSGSRRRARANYICEVRCGNGNRVEEATPTPELSYDAFLTIKYFLWRSTQVVEEA